MKELSLKTNKERYREFCRSFTNEVPLYMQDFWLDALVTQGGSWDVALSTNGNCILGAMPYFFKKKFLLRAITMPPLTQTMGPIIIYPENQKYSSKLSFEKKIITDLIEQLPKVDYLVYNLSPEIKNWLPFYWQKFESNLRYTYVLDNLNDLDKVFNNFESKIKTDIKKAENIVRIEEMDSLGEFYKLNKMTFERQKIRNPYSYSLLQKADNACCKFNLRKIVKAVDVDNKIHAAIYLVWDNKKCYYLLGGGDPCLRNSGATSLLIWEGIKFASERKLVFDFEGSMILGVERFVRGFNARQVPIIQIRKNNSFLVKMLLLLKAR